MQSFSGLGLLGGTFDPAHNGHLALAHAALDVLNLARIDFVLAPAPWQKQVATPVAQRLAMLKAAIGNEPRFAVNTTELEISGPTYTIDTLRALRAKLGPSLPLVLILGGDQWQNLHTWREWECFTDYVNLAVCSRDGRALSASQEVCQWAKPKMTIPAKIRQESLGHICHFTMPSHPASSSKIRSLFYKLGRYEALRALESWLPVPVARIINRLEIYSFERPL